MTSVYSGGLEIHSLNYRDHEAEIRRMISIVFDKYDESEDSWD